MSTVRQIVEEESAKEWLRRHAAVPPDYEHMLRDLGLPARIVSALKHQRLSPGKAWHFNDFDRGDGFYLQTNKHGRDLGEGPWDTPLDAAIFFDSEVGVPCRMVWIRKYRARPLTPFIHWQAANMEEYVETNLGVQAVQAQVAPPEEL
jgi:hypothetical protein